MIINKIYDRINIITSESLGSDLNRYWIPKRSDPIGKKRWTLLEFLVCIFLFFALIFPSAAQAQTVSLSIWPPLLEAVIKPGKAITQVYKLQNLGDDTIVKASLVPFEPADELGHIQINPKSQILNSNFFTLQNANKTLPLTIPLKSGQTEELVLKITIPPTEPEADHYYTFLFEADTEGLMTGTGSKALATIGANILLTVSQTGQLNPFAKIEQFFVSSRSDLNGSGISKGRTLSVLDSFDPINFILKVKNTSPTRLKPIGQIEIKNIFGGVTATLPIREDNILGNSVRQLQLEGAAPALIFGKFTATVSLLPQNTTNTVSQTIAFFVFPYKLIIVLLIFLTIYYYSIHNKKNKKI